MGKVLTYSYLKLINIKRAGHKCGDEVLANVAKVMVDNDRSNDYCVRFDITINAGVAINDDDESFQEVLAHADEKLYQAKHSGRNPLVD
ncbi:diguanylate cyclase domain-containing protein [Photobacterium sp. OFAV2-7]|uniref:diguanylate cyclase domain-containing protein n=1 Tax=Photobacterium sp. OFAV2-7 TaxID=2917748 RepID=UPI001EF4F495|nr:diguanylate cyclase [Photobacterium sp. OFAV2-7]MCG7587952.1 diguanylate cyclase [Photobacterium sp. OFAV2-7]